MKGDRAAHAAPGAPAGSLAQADTARRAADPPARTKGCLLTPVEAAAYLKRTLPAFYAWRRRHAIPNAIKGRTLRVRLDDLVLAQTREDDDALAARLCDFAELGRMHARGELTRPVREVLPEVVARRVQRERGLH